MTFFFFFFGNCMSLARIVSFWGVIFVKVYLCVCACGFLFCFVCGCFHFQEMLFFLSFFFKEKEKKCSVGQTAAVFQFFDLNVTAGI